MKPAKFRLEIDLGNAAFDPDPVPEVFRILEEVTRSLSWTGGKRKLWDVDGNPVGEYEMEWDSHE